jgi:uncharacterized membrane protein
MTTAKGIAPTEPGAPNARIARSSTSDTLLSGAAGFWLLAALAGQWAFFYYISAFYGASILSGNFEVWDRLAALGATAYVPGDTAGNIVFAAHALGAGIIAFGGALQLIPQVRKHAPVFHRWNGRIFLVTVSALSLSGFYLVWVRGPRPDTLAELSTSLNGLLILAFAFLALKAVRARNLVVHRRWAMRLYLVANAQWFLRVGVFTYFAVNQMLGTQASFTDWFPRFWTFGCYLAPLAVLEVYFRARRSSSPLARGAVAAALVATTLLMGVGIAAFGMFSNLIISGAPLPFPD